MSPPRKWSIGAPSRPGQITLSIGAAEYWPGKSAAELVHRADEALYLAKACGRNRVASEADLSAKDLPMAGVKAHAANSDGPNTVGFHFRLGAPERTYIVQSHARSVRP